MKAFEIPELEVEKFNVVDVITTSNDGTGSNGDTTTDDDLFT